MKLSVIIVTWNSERYIGECLDAVLSQGMDAEVIVVDNDSRDRTAEILRGYGGRIRAIRNDGNRGFAAATNQGLACAAGDYLLLLNPDAAPCPGALAAMTAFMDADPRVGALGPQLLNPDGSVQPSCREFPRPVHCLYEFTGLAALFPRHRGFGSWRMGYFDHASQREVDQPMGACLLVRRSAAAAVGPLDAANYPMFLNDVDWCHRIARAGWRIVFDPGARVLHHQGVSIRRARLAMTVSSHRSLARFLLKRSGPSLAAVAAAILVMAALPVRLAWQSTRLALSAVTGHE